MPEELDPIEIELYRQRAQEARDLLQSVAPRGSTLLLSYERDTTSLATFWRVLIHVNQKGERIDVNSSLRWILAIADNTSSPAGQYLSWYGEEESIGEKVTRRIGEVVWDDPNAYRHQIE